MIKWIKLTKENIDSLKTGENFLFLSEPRYYIISLRWPNYKNADHWIYNLSHKHEHSMDNFTHYAKVNMPSKQMCICSCGLCMINGDQNISK